MNGSEINALVTKLVGMAFASYATAAVSSSQSQAIAAGVGALAAVAWGIYSNWNMKKVPETATVIVPITPPKGA